MRSFFIFIIALIFSHASFSQATITEEIFPRYIQGVGLGATTVKVPFVCRVTIKGLTPGATYGYYNKFVSDPAATNTSNGEGNCILVKTTADFKRVTSPSVSPTNANAGTFTADAGGNYTGWFAAETVASAMFTPGNNVYFRVMLNNGSTGISVAQRPTAQTPIKVINFGTASTDGTGIYSTPVTGGTAKNFVFLYDDQAQPVSGTFIESDGSDNSIANGYVDFYANNVNAVDRTWGTIIPNNLSNGIKKIVQYNLSNASVSGSKNSADGRWPVTGGGRKSTVNTTGTTIVLDGAIARLDGSAKTDQTISFNSLAAVTYGDADVDAGATAASGEPVTYSSSNSSVATIVNGKIHLSGAGVTDLTATHPGDDFYNAASLVTQSLTVNKAHLTITANDGHLLQGDPVPAFTASYSGFVNGENESVLATLPVITTTATSSSPAGIYDIVPSGAVASNYDLTYVKGALTVTSTKQQQVITFNALPVKTYGDADVSAGATVNSGLPIAYRSSNTTVATIISNRIHIVGAGTTIITASCNGASAWLPAADVSQPFTVNKASLTITADNKTRLLGQPNPPFTISYGGFVNGESNGNLSAQPLAATIADVNSSAGNYDITVSGAVSGNYNITYVKGVLTILPLAVQQITFTALPSKKYGDPTFNLSATATSGLPVTYASSNTSVAVIQGTQVRIVGAGTTTLTASQAGNTTWGRADNVSQTLIVQKARLIIHANDITKNEGQAVPALTLNYSGFVNNEDSTVLSSLPVASTMATTGSIAGTYTITVQGAAAANYNIAQLNGTLTVLPAQGAAQNNMFAYINSPGQLQVNVFATDGGKGAIQVFDINGTRLVNVNVTFAKGYNTFHVPVGNLARGICNVRVAVADVLLKEKVIIQ